MYTIVAINFDVLIDKCGPSLKPEVIAAFFKQLNDLGVIMVVQTKKDDSRLKTFCGMYLHNPDFFAKENVLVYEKSSDYFENIKAWAKKFHDDLWASSKAKPDQIVIIDKTGDMTGAFSGVKIDTIKVNGTPAYLGQIQSFIGQLKVNIEEKRKERIATLEKEITREKERVYKNHELKVIIKKRNDSDMELTILDAILEVLNRAINKGNISQLSLPTGMVSSTPSSPASSDSSSTNVMAPYETLWNDTMRDLEKFFLGERLDKAKTHNGLWMNGEKLEWVDKDNETALEMYKAWLKKILAEEIATYRDAFIKRLEAGTTQQGMVTLYTKLKEKKGHDKYEYENAFELACAELAREKATLEAEQQREKYRAMNSSVGCIDVMGCNLPAQLLPLTSENANDADVFKSCAGSFINRRKSTLLGSALYDDKNQEKILVDLKAKIAKLGDEFDVDAVDVYRMRALLHIACHRGLDQVVEFLIKEKHANVNLYTPPVLPPIFYAIDFVRQHPFRRRVLQLLLEAGVIVNGGARNADGLTAFSFAATVGEGDNNAFLVEIFLRWATENLGNNVDLFVTNLNKRTAILEAACAGKINVVKMFFKYGVAFTNSDVERLDIVLHKNALFLYKEYLADCIKQFGISLSDSPTKSAVVTSPRKTTCEWAPILHPCYAQLPTLVARYSVKTGSPTGKSGSNIGEGGAARKGSLTALREPTLVKSNSLPKELPSQKNSDDDFDINGLDQNGYAPIHVACVTGHVGLFEELCKRNIKLDVRSKEGLLPLDYAVIHGQLAIVDKLLDKQGVALNVLSDESTLLHSAVTTGNPQLVCRILTKAKDAHQSAYIFRRNKQGNTALMEAILTGNKEVIDIFLQNGIWLSDMDLRNLSILIEDKRNKRDIKNILRIVLTKQLELLAIKQFSQQAALPTPK